MAEIGRIGVGPGDSGNEIEIVVVDHDPTTTPTDTALGSTIIRLDTGEHFRKLDNGSTTNVDSASGGSGSIVAGGWRFSTTITDADPGTGTFRLNNATQASATQIFISKNGQSGLNVGALLLALTTGDKIVIQELSDDSRVQEVEVSGAPVDASTYVKIPITVLSSGSDLRNNRDCGFIFITRGSGVSAELFSGYDAAGGTVLGSGAGGNPTAFVTLPLDSEHKKTSGFTHAASSAEVTINTAGTYVVNGSIGNNVTSGTDRTASEGRLMLDTGGGFVEVGGTRTENYNRTLPEGGNDGSFEVILDLEVGDILRMEGRRLSGDNTVAQKADGTALNIYTVGAQGVQGPTGVPGTGNIDRFDIQADQFEFPVSGDRPVSILNLAPTVTDDVSAGLQNLAFIDSEERGRQWSYRIIGGAVTMTLKALWRAETAPGDALHDIGWKLYWREIPDGGSAPSPTWAGTNDGSKVLTEIANISDDVFFHETTEAITLASEGILDDREYQFILSRVTPAGTNLVDDWFVRRLAVEFS